MKSDPFWWEDAGAPILPSQVDLPAEVDVLVIGAGLTGLSAARTLARAGKHVLVLDSARPGEGASSRNGGMIGGGHRLSIEDMEARFGLDTTVNLLREAHLESTAFAFDLMKNESIECDYTETGRFRGLWRVCEYEATSRSLERLQKIIPLEAAMVPKCEQHKEIATELYCGGVVFPRHGAVNPAKWVAGLLQATQRSGAVIQGQTPVTSLIRNGNLHTAVTPRGEIHANTVLAATNGYTPAHLSHLKRRIIPVPSFIVATEPLGTDKVSRLFPNGRMIVESRERHCYFRPSPNGTRIVFGGRAAMFDAPESLAQFEMRGLLEQVFPDLAGVRITHSWRGRTGFSFDFMPNVGCLNGIWHAMGYSGSGSTIAPYLGHMAALQIMGDPAGETAFSRTEFPLRWWHRGQPWFLPFADVLFRMRDIWNNARRKS